MTCMNNNLIYLHVVTLISSAEYGKPSSPSVVIIYSENSFIMGPLYVSTL